MTPSYIHDACLLGHTENFESTCVARCLKEYMDVTRYISIYLSKATCDIPVDSYQIVDDIVVSKIIEICKQNHSNHILSQLME